MGVGPTDTTQVGSDEPGQSPSALVDPGERARRRSRSSWPTPCGRRTTRSRTAAAATGAHPPRGCSRTRRSSGADDARWGALEAIPTKADHVLDLIRMNSLWPLLSGLACCAMEMMSAATSQERHGPLGHVPVPAPARARPTC